AAGRSYCAIRQAAFTGWLARLRTSPIASRRRKPYGGAKKGTDQLSRQCRTASCCLTRMVESEPVTQPPNESLGYRPNRSSAEPHLTAIGRPSTKTGRLSPPRRIRL